VNNDRTFGFTSTAAACSAVVLTLMGLVFAQAADNPVDVPSAWYLAPITKQLIGVIVGLALMYGLSRATFEWLQRMSSLFLLIALVLLVLPWAPGIGAPLSDGQFHQRIGFGGITVQPAEIAKLALVIWIAAYASKRGRDLSKGSHLAWPLTVTLLICLLVEREPDMGSAVVLFLTALSLLFVAGAQYRHVFSIGALIFILAVLVAKYGAYLGTGHRSGRFDIWPNPEPYEQGNGYQMVQALIAVAASGLKGVGFGNGEGRFYIPAANTDFVMACVAEELGMAGIVIVMVGIGIIIAHAHCVVTRARDSFARLTAAGVGAMILWQAGINLLVVSNSAPCTGVPMPFISFGTSSLAVMLAAVGIILRPMRPAVGLAPAGVRVGSSA